MMSELKRSRRLLGADPEQIRFGKASSQLGNPEVFSQAFSDSGTEDDDDDIFDHSGMIGMSKIRKRRLGAGVDLVAGLRDDPITVAPPFSLGFTKLTIWELGKIVKDESKRENYWSQKTYPVGFKATKSQYGYDWTMTIEEGEDGPVFKVIADDDSLPEFSGPSPTSPWTDVCMTVLGKNSKTRVSGPHQFGFTDPFLQVVIFGMPDHPRIQDMTTLRLVSRQARRGLRFGGRDGAKRKRGRPRNGTGPSEAQANKALVTGQLVDVDWDSVLETERVAELARREERRAKAEAEERERRKAEGRAVSGSGSGPGNGMALRRSTSSSTPTMLGNGLTFARNSSLEKGSIRMKDEYDEHGDREMMEVEVEVDEEITDDDNAFIEPRIVGGREFRPRKPPKRFRKVIKKMLVPVPKRKSGGGGGGGGSSKKSSATGPTGTTMEQSKATAAATAAITINGQEQTPPSKTAPSKQPSRETPAQVEFEKPPPEILARASDPNDDVIYCICELPESDYWNTVACDFCNIWLHMECVGYIDPETMDRSKHHTVKGLHRDGRWKCPRCRKEVRVLG
ncbi:hypothetical protein HDU82_008207 [Entophlyctis luteolus]|nr:hypothetical protein HDU82_008207 [Entophlyctis luteolus]